jgi:hypothetical protein
MDNDFSFDFASYAAVAGADYSPPTDEVFSYPVAVDETFLNEPYILSPAASIAGFFDCDFSATEDGTVSPADLARAGTTVPHAVATRAISTLPRLPPTPAFDSTPFGQLEPSPSGFCFDTNVVPQRQIYQTSSINDDDPQQLQLPSSEDPSLHPSLKREPTKEDAASASPATRRPPKRGRPRLYQNTTSTSTFTDNSSPSKSQRLPHNQVERKYRENLNAELERLRRAIPTLPQTNATDGGLFVQPKPSKAMIIAGATEYIQMIERERNEYRAECETLRALLG